jgi:hypothetical protein
MNKVENEGKQTIEIVCGMCSLLSEGNALTETGKVVISLRKSLFVIGGDSSSTRRLSGHNKKDRVLVLAGCAVCSLYQYKIYTVLPVEGMCTFHVAQKP